MNKVGLGGLRCGGRTAKRSGISVLTTRREATEDEAIRQILDRIETDQNVSQRDLADELGVALGMVNAYIKRCVHKGLVKIQEVPRRRYSYYLTPQGFAEKSRLTAQYLTDSFGALRRGLTSFDRLYTDLAESGYRRIVLCGDDEMVEVGILASLSTPLEIVGVFNPLGDSHTVRGVPAIDPANAPEADRWVLAVTKNGEAAYGALERIVAADRIAMPDVLRLAMLRGSQAHRGAA